MSKVQYFVTLVVRVTNEAGRPISLTPSTRSTRRSTIL
jgi:hypothetical protein